MPKGLVTASSPPKGQAAALIGFPEAQMPENNDGFLAWDMKLSYKTYLSKQDPHGRPLTEHPSSDRDRKVYRCKVTNFNGQRCQREVVCTRVKDTDKCRVNDRIPTHDDWCVV
jgi:hypothetical protein